MQPNGTHGWSQFPIHERATYIIRDNRVACEHTTKSSDHYDIFLVTGDKPTLHKYEQSQFVCSTNDYSDACDIIERIIARVTSMVRVNHYSEWTNRRSLSR